MKSGQTKLIDWVNLPEHAHTVSLWDTLHDGDLISIHSDRLARTVFLSFDIDYVREFNQLPQNSRFSVHFGGVCSVRVTWSEPWPGEFTVPGGVSRDEESRLIAEYQAKWREESRSWGEFERLIEGKGGRILDAELALASNAATARIVLEAQNRYYEAHIRAENRPILSW